MTSNNADFSQQTENRCYDKKSLKLIVGEKSDWNELAKDCVCFANARGGVIDVGIEDHEQEPSPEQRLPADIVERTRKRIQELTINVSVSPQLLTATNGGEYLKITIPRSPNVASTSRGKFYIRVSDTCEPVLGDDVLRLFSDRAAAPWESLTNLQVPREQIDRISRCARNGDADTPSVHQSIKKILNLLIILLNKVKSPAQPKRANSFPYKACRHKPLLIQMIDIRGNRFLWKIHQKTC